MRSTQSRIAVGSPTSASSTALRVNASNSPESSAAAESVAFCASWSSVRQNCLTAPSHTAAHAPAPVVLVKAHQSCASPRFKRHPSGTRNWLETMRKRRYYGWLIGKKRPTSGELHSQPEGGSAGNHFLTDDRHSHFKSANLATPDGDDLSRSTGVTYEPNPVRFMWYFTVRDMREADEVNSGRSGLGRSVALLMVAFGPLFRKTFADFGKSKMDNQRKLSHAALSRYYVASFPMGAA